MAGMATPFAAISSKNFLLSKWLGTATLTKVVSRMQLKCVICAQKHRIGDCPKLDEADGKERTGNLFVALEACVSPSGIANDPAMGSAGNSRHRVRSLTERRLTTGSARSTKFSNLLQPAVYGGLVRRSARDRTAGTQHRGEVDPLARLSLLSACADSPLGRGVTATHQGFEHCLNGARALPANVPRALPRHRK